MKGNYRVSAIGTVIGMLGLLALPGYALTFSNIEVTAIKTTSVVIRWDTDSAATGQIEYGLDINYGNLTEEQGLSYWHPIEVTGLIEDTTYHYRIRAIDYKGEETISADSTFTTRTQGELDSIIRAARAIGDLPKIYYVSPTGSNSNNGLSLDSAWATPKYASSIAEAGDTIYVVEGNYSGGVDFGHFQGYDGIPEAPITMKAYDNGTPDISGVIDVRSDYITFDGFVCHDAGSHAIDLRYNTGINMLNCEVYNSGVDCIYLRDATYVILDNCTVHDSGWNGFGLKPSTSWPASGHHVILRNCEAYDIMEHNAFDVQDDYMTLENCYAHNSLLAPMRLLGDRVVVNHFNGEDGNNGIALSSSLRNSMILNCILDAPIMRQSGSVRNSIFSNNNITYSQFAVLVVADTGILVEENEVYSQEGWGYTYGLEGTGDVTIRNENVTTTEPDLYRVRSIDGATITVEYTDGRTFSVNGSGNYTTYTWSSGTRTIRVFEPSVDELVTSNPHPYFFSSIPNPFSEYITITYQLPAAFSGKSTVFLKVYDTTGKLVKILADANQKPGYYTIYWDGRDADEKDVASGVYFLRLIVSPADRAGNFSTTKKLLLVK